MFKYDQFQIKIRIFEYLNQTGLFEKYPVKVFRSVRKIMFKFLNFEFFATKSVLLKIKENFKNLFFFILIALNTHFLFFIFILIYFIVIYKVFIKILIIYSLNYIVVYFWYFHYTIHFIFVSSLALQPMGTSR